MPLYRCSLRNARVTAQLVHQPRRSQIRRASRRFEPNRGVFLVSHAFGRCPSGRRIGHLWQSPRSRRRRVSKRTSFRGDPARSTFCRSPSTRTIRRAFLSLRLSECSRTPHSSRRCQCWRRLTQATSLSVDFALLVNAVSYLASSTARIPALHDRFRFFFPLLSGFPMFVFGFLVSGSCFPLSRMPHVDVPNHTRTVCFLFTFSRSKEVEGRRRRHAVTGRDSPSRQDRSTARQDHTVPARL